MRTSGNALFSKCLCLLAAIALAGCNSMPGIDLAPDYTPPEYIVPASWHGGGPFIEARPSDAEIRTEWWRLFHDPVLDRLEEQAMTANADLHAAAERFMQARDLMMKARSHMMPQINLGFDASDNKESQAALFRSLYNPIYDTSVSDRGGVSWKPDLWYAIRNETRARQHALANRGPN